MMDVLGPIFWFLVATGILIAWHEYGHFWTARRCGVRVLRFAIGFGPPLFSRTGRDGTEYVVAAIPLGGYVRMLDEKVDDLGPDDQGKAFGHRPLAQRSAIVAAGPIANLILAIGFFWLMFVLGVPDLKPVLGPTEGVVKQAGLNEGDQLIEVGGQPVQSWTDAIITLVPQLYARGEVELKVLKPGLETPQTVRLDLSTVSRDIEDERIFEAAGFRTWTRNPPAQIGLFAPDSAAEAAGLKLGDRIVAINGQPVSRFAELAELLQTEAPKADGRVELSIERGGDRLSRTVSARRSDEGGRTVWRIGVGPERHATELHYGPLEAVPAALSKTWNVTASTFGVLYRMVTGEASLKNISGPVTIAQVTDAAAGQGLADFLRILGIISLSLCILNLLPVPMLDGGRLLYFAWEGVRGAPLPERVQLAGYYVGMVLIVGLMTIALYNDVARHFGAG
jgi:regulator of sigma E protease